MVNLIRQPYRTAKIHAKISIFGKTAKFTLHKLKFLKCRIIGQCQRETTGS